MAAGDGLVSTAALSLSKGASTTGANTPVSPRLLRASASKDRAQRSQARRLGKIAAISARAASDWAMSVATDSSGPSDFDSGAGALQMDTLLARKKKLRFGRSGIHAWGVFSEEPLASGDMLLEYRGQIIGNAVADKREQLYERQKIGSDYMFRIDADTVVDATRRGALARFVNHSCDPNCYTQIISHRGQKKIVIYAKHDICVGEELVYDYKFPIEEDKIPCYCGASKCRGTMN
jgi:histone-lysine N-methyltransferase SETD1